MTREIKFRAWLETETELHTSITDRDTRIKLFEKLDKKANKPLDEGEEN